MSRDPADFNDANLAGFDVVIFLITGPHALGAEGQEEQRAALQNFVRNGGGFAGIHSVTATDRGWEWFADMVGAGFAGHPPHPNGVQPGTLRKYPGAPLVDELPDVWVRCEEWHSFDPSPVGNTELEFLLMLDEKCTPSVGETDLAMGTHPMAWRRTYDGGRVFVTALGHSAEAYNERAFLSLVTSGIEWAAGR